VNGPHKQRPQTGKVWGRDHTCNELAGDRSISSNSGHQCLSATNFATSNVLRAQDRIQEGYISWLATQYVQAHDARDELAMRRLWESLRQAINSRSPEQVARMESAIGMNRAAASKHGRSEGK